MKPDAKTRKNLCRIAEFLQDQQHLIIEAWCGKALNDDNLNSVNSLSRKEFLDHVPDILDGLRHQLRNLGHADLASRTRAPSARSATRIHGIHRWQQGFSVVEVTRDWNHLRTAILEEITHGVEANPDWAAHGFAEAICILSDRIAEGITQSLEQFEALRQAEAKIRLADLQERIDAIKRSQAIQNRHYREVRHDLHGHLGLLANLVRVGRSETDSDTLSEIRETLDEGLNATLELLDDLKLQTCLDAEEATVDAETIDLGTLVVAIAAPFCILAEKRGIAFDTCGPSPQTATTDPAKFARILQNLLRNALDYTVEGNIELTWGASQPENSFSVIVKNRGLLAGKRSTGEAEAKGPDPNARPSGEGIGLSIAHRMARLLSGVLRLDYDADGKGATATLTIPLRA